MSIPHCPEGNFDEIPDQPRSGMSVMPVKGREGINSLTAFYFRWKFESSTPRVLSRLIANTLG